MSARIKNGCIVGFFVFISISPIIAFADQCEQGEKSTTNFGQWFDFNAEISSDVPIKVDPGLGPQFDSMRLEFLLKQRGGDNWTVVIRSAGFEVLGTFGPNDFSPDGQSRWTGKLAAVPVFVEMNFSKNTGAILEIRKGLAFAKPIADQKVFSTQQEIPSWKKLFEQGNTMPKRAAYATGILTSAAYGIDGVKRSWCCSGTMIAANVFLTNWHCGGSKGMAADSYWNTQICSNTIVNLAQDEKSEDRQYSCNKVIAKDHVLDFAVLRLQPTLGEGANVGQPPQAKLSLAESTQTAFMVHHALCQPKLVSVCTDPIDMESQTEVNFKHTCDSEPGASGAPLFDSKGRLVGLHHSGFERDAACIPTDKFNKATSIKRIVDSLSSSASDLMKELWIDPD